MPATRSRHLPAMSALFVPPGRSQGRYAADRMMSAVRRAWVAFWAATITGALAGVDAIVLALTRSLWYFAFVAVDFAAVALLVWAIIQLRQAHEHARADAAERETIVRSYIMASQGRSDRDHL